MSFSSYFFDNFFHRYQDLFGTELYPNQYLICSLPEHRIHRSFTYPIQKLKSHLAQIEDYQKNLHIGKDGKFHLHLDVEHFKPDEISVKTVDNSIIIEAKHDEREDELGFISRHSVRRYELPSGYKTEHLVSKLSSDGILTIECPKTEAIEGVLVREVKIQHSGPARVTSGKSDVDKKIEAVKEGTEERAEEKKAEEKE